MKEIKNGKIRHICFFSLIFCFLLMSCSTKENKEAPSPVVKQMDKELKFPEDWLGYWEGELEIYNAKGLAQTIPMALDHRLTDTLGTYGWAIIYGEDLEKGRRDYYLKEIDKSKGHYVTDEKNGILLDAFVIDNRLTSSFEVEGTLITSSYILINDTLHFEIFASNTKEARISGDGVSDGEEIPEVRSFKSTGYQRGRLYKKNTLSIKE